MLYHRINFESEKLLMQHQQVMTDLQTMRQQMNRALCKSNHLKIETQRYWSLTYWVVTSALGTECVSPSLSLNQSEDHILYCLTPSRKPASKKALRVFFPLGVSLTKFEEPVSLSNHCPSN